MIEKIRLLSYIETQLNEISNYMFDRAKLLNNLDELTVEEEADLIDVTSKTKLTDCYDTEELSFHNYELGQLKLLQDITKFIENAPVKIRSLHHLREVAEGEFVDCFILLNGGLRSSKRVLYARDIDAFEIHNEIDDTYQELTEEGLYSNSNIGDAIIKGSFYLRY